MSELFLRISREIKIFFSVGVAVIFDIPRLPTAIQLNLADRNCLKSVVLPYSERQIFCFSNLAHSFADLAN